MKKKRIWEMGRLNPEEFRSAPKIPLIVVLDNVRSLNNIGSVFRTCDAFAVSAVFLCGISQTPPSAEIHKTALGAEDTVQWQYFANTADAIELLRTNHYEICCLEQVFGSVSLQDFTPDPQKKYAVVVGHEVFGVDQQIVDMADHCIEIPQAGTKHSLNVAVSTGITIWHFFEALKGCVDADSH